MRVIAGSCKGKVLISPKGMNIRPTSDRIKEYIFSFIGDDIVDSQILDLFSGTGNLTIEGLSRGAGSVISVDVDRESIKLIRKNLSLTKFIERCRIVQKDVFAFIGKSHHLKFNYIFADPPYFDNIYVQLIHEIDKHEILKEGGFFVLEHSSRIQFEAETQNMIFISKKIFGDSAITFFRKK